LELVDTHAHLEDIEDLDGALERAEKEGVVAVLTMGSDYESNNWSIKESVKYSREKLKIYPSVGFHPWNLNNSNVEVSLRFIEENISKSVAVGEIGLDYWYRDVRKNIKKKEEQKRLFQKLLEISKKNDRPVSIHSRGAWADCVNMTIETGIEKAVFHWFSGPLDVLKKLLDHGYYVSATPAAAYSKEHRAVIAKTPLENLLLETDSTVAYQGEPSEPAHLIKALSAVAELKSEKEQKIAEETTENARLIFKIL